MRADFHMHSNISDGSDSSDQLFKMASKAGLDIISVTDHDTLDGRIIHRKNAEKYKIKYIPGVEISAYDYTRDRSVHLIGLNVNEECDMLNNMLEKTLSHRHRVSVQRIEILKNQDYDIKMDDFIDRMTLGIYKQHIMTKLIERGYAKELYGSFYQEHFKNNGFLDIKIDYPDHLNAVKAIVEARGIAILAHPGMYDSYDAVEEMVKVGLKGIEYVYPSVTAEDQTRIKNLADLHDLILSGGSDYHGANADQSNGQIGDYYIEIEDPIT